MPESGAQPVPNQDYMDAGDGIRATLYTDGSVVFWREDTQEQVGYLPPGGENPVDLKNGKAATLNPDGSLLVFDISNPPPEVAGTIPTGAAPGEVPAPPTVARPGQPTGPVGTRNPGEDFNYGVTRPGAGVYPGASAYPNQRTPGRQTDIPFGQTVAPSTWNPADLSQGRSEGWGTIGAQTAGIPYGYGVPGFGKDPIKINEDYLDNLGDPKQSPGYIPGSGTYNQFMLNDAGLFGTVPGQQGEVNLRYGLGGTGDPTTGREVQTPERWITGNAAASTQAVKGDAGVRAGGTAGAGATTRPRPSRSCPPTSTPPQEARPVPYGTGGRRDGGRLLRRRAGLLPRRAGNLWGKARQPAGLDYLITLFMRSDTPTGIIARPPGAPPSSTGTAWSPPSGTARSWSPTPRAGPCSSEEPGVHPPEHRRGGPDRGQRGQRLRGRRHRVDRGRHR